MNSDRKRAFRNVQPWHPATALIVTLTAFLAAGYALAGEAGAERPTLSHTDALVQHAEASRLLVTVDTPRAQNGEVRLDLFDMSGEFAGTRDVAVHRISGEGGVALFDLQGLEPGVYAFQVFFDANGNGELDRGLVGRPLEPRFVSNNAAPLWGAPDWERASFRLTGGDFAVAVSLD